MDLNTALYILYAIAGLGVIVFIHELGHFLAAKKVGVKVHTFSVGFDPTIFGRKMRLFSFRRGETEYVIGLIPLGGYVKMAGESEFSEDVQNAGQDSESDRWLVNKSAGARAVVFAAGAFFNVVSAIIFFLIAFSLGVQFNEPTLGEVVPGSPAWRAGLEAGDKVVAIDGKPLDEFHELMVAIALGDRDASLEVTVERDSGQKTFTVTPEFDPGRGFNTIGILPAFRLRVGEVEPGSLLDDAGLQEGDTILKARSGRLEVGSERGSNAIPLFIDEMRGSSIEFLCEREGEEIGWKKVDLRIDPDGKPKTLLGVRPLFTQTVKATRPGSDAGTVLRPGDRLLTVGGQPYQTLTPRVLAGLEGGETIPLVIEGQDGETRDVNVEFDRLVDWSLGRQIQWQEHGTRLGALPADSALANAGLREGDVILSLGGSWTGKPGEVGEKAGNLGEGVTAVDVVRDGRRVSPRPEVTASIFADLEPSTWNLNPRVLVLDEAYPSARLGMESFSRVTKIGSHEVTSWDSLREAVTSSEGKEVEVSWVTPSGETRSGTTKLEAPSYEILGLVSAPRKFQKQETSLIGAASLGFKRTWISARWVFLTLKGLLNRQVAARNLSGPVGIVHLIVRVSEAGLGTLIYYLALISVNLGIFNLLPIPILDGGHLLFLLIEKVKGSPVSLRTQEIATTVCFFLFIGLALFVTYHDLLRLFRF